MGMPWRRTLHQEEASYESWEEGDEEGKQGIL
jgi:hypothetical protein